MPISIAHLSDIHFHFDSFANDANLDIRNELLRDLRQLLGNGGKLDALVISGDVAYHATVEEYESADKWIKKICNTTRCPKENVFICPGNHDIDWNVLKQNLHIEALHDSIRQFPTDESKNARVTAILKSKNAGDLYAPLENYNNFAKHYKSAYLPSKEDYAWTRQLTLNDESLLKIRGLNSALLSGTKDKPRSLFLGRSAWAMSREEGVEYLVFSHHPPSWLADGSVMSDTFNRTARIQLYGHEHSQRIERVDETVRIYAGSVNPHRDEGKWEPAYNLIQLDVEESGGDRHLNVRIFARDWQNVSPQKFRAYAGRGLNESHEFRFNLPERTEDPPPPPPPPPPAQIHSYTIAHLSDLHLDLPGASAVWSGLADYLNRLKPDLLLITGDIVEVATTEALRSAKRTLDFLNVDYWVCPGNTDRIANGDPAQTRNRESFEDIFVGHVPSVGADAYSPEGRQNTWRIALISVDTTNAVSSLKGGAPSSERHSMTRNASKVANDVDLCIVLQHHQLLPVSVLQGPGGPAGESHDPMENLGAYLHSLANSNVNLVLHGHEHRAFAAKYSTMSRQRSDVTIVGAGSATGLTTQDKVSVENGSFNMLEFCDDGSVWLEEHTGATGTWAANAKSSFELFSARDIQKIRQRRACKIVDIPVRRTTKRIEFMLNRDIRVSELRAPCDLLSSVFEYQISNSSGTPVCEKFEIDWSDGTTDTLLTSILPKPGENHRFILKAVLPDGREPASARSIRIEILWKRGALLTADDWDLMARGGFALGDFRPEKREFAAHCQNEALQELVLIVDFPIEFTPELSDIQPMVEPLGNRTEPINYKSLKEDLRPRKISQNQYMLSVPFPYTNTIFGLTWNLNSLKGRTSRLANAARESLVSIEEKVRQSLPENLRGFWNFGLYEVHHFNGGPHWVQIFPAVNGSTGDPEESAAWAIRREGVYLDSYWGEVGVGFASVDTRVDMLDGESLVVSIPLMPKTQADGAQPPFMIRLGYAVGRFAPAHIASNEIKEAAALSGMMVLNELERIGRI